MPPPLARRRARTGRGRPSCNPPASPCRKAVPQRHQARRLSAKRLEQSSCRHLPWPRMAEAQPSTNLRRGCCEARGRLRRDGVPPRAQMPVRPPADATAMMGPNDPLPGAKDVRSGRAQGGAGGSPFWRGSARQRTLGKGKGLGALQKSKRMADSAPLPSGWIAKTSKSHEGRSETLAPASAAPLARIGAVCPATASPPRGCAPPAHAPPAPSLRSVLLQHGNWQEPVGCPHERGCSTGRPGHRSRLAHSGQTRWQPPTGLLARRPDHHLQGRGPGKACR